MGRAGVEIERYQRGSIRLTHPTKLRGHVLAISFEGKTIVVADTRGAEIHRQIDVDRIAEPPQSRRLLQK